MSDGQLKNLCVYCGSRPGARPAYLDMTRQLGEEMLQRDIGLVYGRASIGLMGQLADVILDGGGRVTGIIPKALAKEEVAHTGLSELLVVGSMHERKAKMAELADGFIALPGGLGTLEELFEILTWAQLGMHAKPSALLNVSAYYDDLLRFLEKAVDEAFIKQSNLDMLLVDDMPARLIDKMTAYQAPMVEALISPAET